MESKTAVIGRPTPFTKHAPEVRPDEKTLGGETESAIKRDLSRLCVLMLVAVCAAVVRMANLGYASLPHDEAFRANWWFATDPTRMRRFPPLQWVLGWSTQHIFGQSEFVLRLPYAIAGVGCVVLLYWVVRHRLGVGAGLWVALLAAGHPVLVEASRQAKVFSLETLIVPSIILVAVRACKQATTGRVIAFLLLGLVGFGLTLTGSMAIGVCIPFVVLAWARTDPFDRAGKFVMFSSLILLAAAGAFWFWWLSDFATRNLCISYYATEEQTWPVAYNVSTLAFWMIDSCYGALQYVTGMSHTWPPLSWSIATLFTLAICAAIPVLWRSFRLHLIFFSIMLAVTIFAGAIRQWPFGNIRHTTFLIPFVVLAGGVGMWELTRHLGRSPARVMLLAFCVALPYVRAVKASVVSPPTPEHVRPLFEYVEHYAAADDAMFVYYPVDEAFWYYWRGKSMPALVQPREDRGKPDVFEARFEQWMSQHKRVWFVFAHDWGGEKKAWTEILRRKYFELDSFEIGGSAVYLFSETKESEPILRIKDPYFQRMVR